MKTYINIVNYTSGVSLKEQINEMLAAGKIDEDTRLFFSKSNCLTMRDLAEIWVYFSIEMDLDFDMQNLVLKPSKMLLRIANKEGGKLI